MIHLSTIPPINESLDLTDFENLARVIGPQLRTGDVVYLKGDLGSGKTTFARALIQGLMGRHTAVPSPTFTLVQTYEAPHIDIVHYDLYRLETVDDCLELGFDEALSSGALLIEWPERLGRISLSPKTLTIHFSLDPVNPERRCVRFEGF